MAKAKNHPSVDWLSYFESIGQQCPWSLAAWRRGQIEIQLGAPTSPPEPLGVLQARVYQVIRTDADLQAMADQFNTDSTQDEWLFSYPGYGAWATPVPVLIQQNRQQLQQLRQQLQ